MYIIRDLVTSLVFNIEVSKKVEKWSLLGGVSFQGWLLAWIRHRKLKVDVCIPTSSCDVCANVGGDGCSLTLYTRKTPRGVSNLHALNDE